MNTKQGTCGTATATVPTTTITSTISTSGVDTQWQALVAEGDILLNRSVPALSINNVKVGQIVRHQEEHVHLLTQILEARCVVRKLVARICCRSIPQEDALYLIGILYGHLRIIFHDIRVGCVCDQNELALWKRLENPVQEVLAD